MKAQGATEDEINAQKLRVKNARTDLDQFCDETGRARQKAREATPINAEFPDGYKQTRYENGIRYEPQKPNLSTNAADVSDEYVRSSLPGVGTVTKEAGEKQKAKQHEIDVANELVRKVGGNVVLLDNSGRDPVRDATWHGKTWEIKKAYTLSAAQNAAVQKHGANSFYMVKLPAEFSSILFRSEYGSQEPYPTLVEALKGKQTEFTEKNIKGTLVGLYCPSYMGELNSVGWHFHFISDDKKKGGHILELSIKEATAYLDQTDKFTMVLHDDKKFHDINLSKDMKEDIRSAEQDTKGKLTGEK